MVAVNTGATTPSRALPLGRQGLGAWGLVGPAGGAGSPCGSRSPGRRAAAGAWLGWGARQAPEGEFKKDLKSGMERCGDSPAGPGKLLEGGQVAPASGLRGPCLRYHQAGVPEARLGLVGSGLGS